MSEQVSVEVGPAGGPVAVKRAARDDRRVRLRREAEMLEAARSPGVVDLVAFDDDASEASLSTAWLGGGTFATASLRPKKLAAASAALALTVSVLHDRGIVHGRITDDHVLLDSAGRVVLGGFAEAEAAGGVGDATAADVQSIGDLIASKLPAEPSSMLKLRTHSPDNEIIERLRAIAARASDPDPTRRPSAKALAGLLAEISGDVPARGPIRLGRPDQARPAAAPHPLAPALDAAKSAVSSMSVHRPGLGRRALAGAGGLALVAIVALTARAAFAGGGSNATAEVPTASALVATTTPTTPTSVYAVNRVWPTTTPPPSISPCAASSGGGESRDIDGDGCPEAVTVGAGAILVDDQRYDIGEPNDAITIADWDCDGRDTAALVRPDTGEVYVFDGWAAADAPATAQLVDRVAGATSLAPPDQCGVLTVLKRDGTSAAVTLDVEASR